jgi:hypothetical protein
MSHDRSPRDDFRHTARLDGALGLQLVSEIASATSARAQILAGTAAHGSRISASMLEAARTVAGHHAGRHDRRADRSGRT